MLMERLLKSSRRTGLIPDLTVALLIGFLATAGNAQTATVPQSGTEVGSHKSALSSLVSELSSLPDTAALHIVYQWAGLAPGSPIMIDYPLVLKDGKFVGKAIHSEQRTSPEGFPLNGVGPGGDRVIKARRYIAIPRDAVQTFLRAVLEAKAEEREYLARIDHTDDYPSLAFELQGPKGKVLIGTASQPMTVNGHASRAPWGILYADRTFVVSTCEIDLALEPLSKYFWKMPRPPSPFVGMPQGPVPPANC